MTATRFAFDWLSHQQKGLLGHEKMRTKTQKQFLREETFWNHYKLRQDRYQMANMLECAVIVLWLQLGCKLEDQR